MSPSADVFGLAISTMSREAAVSACRERGALGHGGYVCFVNAHTASESTVNPALRAALGSAAFCFADGMPLVWLAHLKKQPVSGRVCGPDFMERMLEVERGRVHGFIGGAPGRATTLAEAHRVAAITYSPPMRAFTPQHALEDWEQFVSLCPDRRPPAFVWVGLGAPKQELWLATVSQRAPSTLFFGVGAAFDFLAGAMPRAPRALQAMGLEWAYRLASDPRRLWKRYLKTNAHFVALAMRDVLRR